MEALRIVKEIMDSANNIKGRPIHPIPYFRRVKQESTGAIEVITVEEETKKTAPPKENETPKENEDIETEKTTSEGATGQETPDRKPVEAKGDKSAKKRVERMIQKVKNDENNKKKKENQKEPRD